MTSNETAFSLFEGMDFDQSYDRGQKRQKTYADYDDQLSDIKQY